jgi:hypothetical protein
MKVSHVIGGTYSRGDTVGLRGLTLQRQGTDGNQWMLYDEEEQLVDVLDAHKTKSARAFLQYIEKVLGEDETRWAP